MEHGRAAVGLEEEVVGANQLFGALAGLGGRRVAASLVRMARKRRMRLVMRRMTRHPRRRLASCLSTRPPPPGAISR